MAKTPNKEFWLTNITKKDITLYDLGVIIRAHTSVNLLNNRHYSLTPEQLELSLTKGSLSQKRNMIIKRESAPDFSLKSFKVAIDVNSKIPNRARSLHEIKHETYEELIVSDEQFAEENAETVDMDKLPSIKG